MISSTSSTINSLRTFHLSKIQRCLRTSFSLLSLVPLTTSMLDIVFILTLLVATFLRLRTIIPSCLSLSVQTVSGMDPLTGLLFLSIFLPPPSFLTFPVSSVLRPINFALLLLFPLSTPSSLRSPRRLAVLVSTSPPQTLSPEETFFSICPTLPLLRTLMILPLPFALLPLMRSLMLFVPPVKNTNKHVILGELSSSMLILLPLINISPFTALLTPPTLHDMHTMILELATFLTSFAFLDDGSPLQELESAPPSPGSLLSPLSSIHSDHMNVYPGEGVFFLDNCPDPTSGDPMIVTWLASFTRCPPPVPAFFPDMLTCLSPGDRNTMPGIFANTLQLMEPRPIPLGPCAQIHLTSSLLPPPFFRATAQLHLSDSPCGGVGTLQVETLFGTK